MFNWLWLAIVATAFFTGEITLDTHLICLLLILIRWDIQDNKKKEAL